MQEDKPHAISKPRLESTEVANASSFTVMERAYEYSDQFIRRSAESPLNDTLDFREQALEHGHALGHRVTLGIEDALEGMHATKPVFRHTAGEVDHGMVL